ncbi:MAG TPA: glycosyltransferase [Gemmataceae bacterium]|jgi:GT2 family glycosyltransferase
MSQVQPLLVNPDKVQGIHSDAMERGESYQARWKALEEAWARETAYLARIAELEQRVLLEESFAWAIASRLSALRRLLAPETTRRDRWLRLCLRGLRLWQREGWRVLGRRAAAKVGRRLKHDFAFLARRRQSLPKSDFERWLANQWITPDEQAKQRQFARDYARWFAKQQLTPKELAAQRQAASAFVYRPLISILTPTYNPPKKILRATLACLQAQTYDRWELCVADGRSTDPAVRRVLEKAAKADPRIRVRFLAENGGISRNSNVCLEMARGEFVALLDHDDMLAPSALFEVARRLNEDPQLDFLYSDKDHISEDGLHHFSPCFKPAWSPDIMLMGCYLTHFTVLRTERVRAVGGFNPEIEGAQDWDLFFRVLEGTCRIAHIPKVLYHWRFWPQSTSAGIEAKPYAVAAQLRAINDHCRRSGRKAEVALGAWGCSPRLRRGSLGARSITVVLRTDGTGGRLPALLHMLQHHQSRDNLTVVVAHVGPLPSALPDYYESLTRDHQARVVFQRADESIPALLNRAAHGQEVDLLFFLSDWLYPVEGWLDDLVVCAEQPGVAIVGGQLLSPDHTILQGMLVLRRDGQVLPLFAGMSWGERNCFGDANWYRNCSALGAAGLMIRRQVFDQVGGFNPDYQQAGYDVDLCCRVRAQGQRILYNPFVRFIDQSGEGHFVPLETADQERLRTTCREFLADGDPYFNANLADHSSRPLLRAEPRP